MSEPSFWQRVQEHLDARRDPLDDPDVQRFLLDHPQHLEEFAELQRGLRALEPIVSHKLRKRLPVAAAVAAAAVLVLALGLLWLLQPPDLATPDLAHGCRVLELDIKTVVQDREIRTETWVDRSAYIPRTVETITYLNPDPTHVTSLEIVETRSLTE